jgi:MFS family permease
VRKPSTAFVRVAQLERLERAGAVSDRAVALVFLARFVDEILSGAWTVLAPTFRRAFGLSLVQVGLLTQVVEWVALVVEPPAATLIDLRSRRALISFGGICVGVSTLLMGVAPTYASLLAAFAVYGFGSGPLAHTADVVIVEEFAGDADRAYARATFLDTVGALAGPGLVALVAITGLGWEALLVILGAGAIAYATALGATRFPPPPHARHESGPLLRAMATNVRKAVSTPASRRALLFLLFFDVFESAFVLKYVWLAEAVGMRQSGAALYAVGEQVIALGAIVVLDRVLKVRSPTSILRFASALLVVIPGVWVAAPGIAGRVAIGTLLAAVQALVWPVAKSRALAAAPGVAGAVTAVTTLYAALPLALIQAQLAQSFGVGRAIAVTAAVGAALMLATTFAPA